MKPNGSKWAVRTIRNGRVRIGGVVYVPNESHMKYGGQLDGTRWAFARYWHGDHWATFVNMWGSEKAYRFDGDPDTSSDEAQDWPGANCIGGFFRWDWWDAINTPPRPDCGYSMTCREPRAAMAVKVTST